MAERERLMELERDGKVATIVLNRPEKVNAWSWDIAVSPLCKDWGCFKILFHTQSPLTVIQWCHEVVVVFVLKKVRNSHKDLKWLQEKESAHRKTGNDP